MPKEFDINEKQPHEVAELICVNCKYRHISVHMVKTTLKIMECSECGEIGYLIKTGQDLDAVK